MPLLFKYIVFFIIKMRNKMAICSSLEDQQDNKTENLWDAISNKNWALVEELVKNGADIYINKYNQPDHGFSILSKAISNNQWQLAEYLIDHSQINYMSIYSSFDSNNPLWDLARKKQWRLAKKLILHATSESIMPQDSYNIGNLIIWNAAKEQEWEWIQELAKRFSNVNLCENIIGFTKDSALSFCIYHRKWEVISELLKHANKNNKIKIIEQLSKITKTEPIAVRIIVNNLFNIPKYIIKPLPCEPQTSSDINKKDINEFYKRLDGYSRCRQINGEFRKKSDNSYKEKMHDKFMEATRLKFSPLGGEQQLRHGDIFSSGIEEASKVQKKMRLLSNTINLIKSSQK